MFFGENDGLCKHQPRKGVISITVGEAHGRKLNE